MSRVYNFYAGPATLPLPALEEAQKEFLDYKSSGMSIIESSHRGKEYDAVHTEAIDNFKTLLKLPDNYSVMFLPGGASFQFAMIPMNLLGKNSCADYINSGSWASKAIKEAKTVGNVNVAADTSKELPARMPLPDELKLSSNAAYFHITTNETIAGTQLKEIPESEAPIVADMSSDILSRPIDINKFGLIYAGAQKNLGPSGIALVVIRNDLVEKANENLPAILKYKTHIEKNSLYNTPATFSIYIMALVSRWMLNQGPEKIYEQNRKKAQKIYDIIDNSEFYKGTAQKEHRSDMNITFRLPSEELEKQFVAESTQENLKGLKGHRSVGGIRASIYNAFPMEGIDALASFMSAFEKRNA